MEVSVQRDATLMTITGPKAIFVGNKQLNQAMQFGSHLFQAPQLAGTRWALKLKIVSVIIVKFPERFDNKEVDREPYGSTLVRVSAKNTRPRFAGLIPHGHQLAIPLEAIGMVRMYA